MEFRVYLVYVPVSIPPGNPQPSRATTPGPSGSADQLVCGDEGAWESRRWRRYGSKLGIRYTANLNAPVFSRCTGETPRTPSADVSPASYHCTLATTMSRRNAPRPSAKKKRRRSTALLSCAPLTERARPRSKLLLGQVPQAEERVSIRSDRNAPPVTRPKAGPIRSPRA